jgi:HEAT repeat protein
MRFRLVLASIIVLSLGVGLLAWWKLPHWWPNAVVAYSPFMEPAIRAEAWRNEGGRELSIVPRVPYVSLDGRVRKDPVAGQRALVRALRSTDPAVRVVAADALRNLGLDPGADAADLVVIATHVDDPDARVRASLLALIAPLRYRQDLLRAALRDPVARVRLAAVQGLGCWQDANLVPDLLAMISDANDAVACAAMRQVGAYHDPRIIAPLLAALAGNRPGVVSSAGGSLLAGPLTPEQRESTLALLVRAMRSDGVRYSAMAAENMLSGSLGEEAIPHLRRALDDPDYQCRQYAASLLRQQGEPPSPRLIAVTVEGLQDDDYPLARDHSHYTYLTNAKDGTRWLWLHPDAGTAELRLALASADAQQRFLAAWLLGMRTDVASAASIAVELVPRLAVATDSWSARASAAWAIRALYLLGPVVRPQIEAALPGTNAQQTACLQLLLRDWADPPGSSTEAARRAVKHPVRLSLRYHDPAWEPAQEAPGMLSEPFPRL